MQSFAWSRMISWDRLANRTWSSLLSLDRECRITMANEAAHALARLPPGELVGRRFCEAFATQPCPHPVGDSCPFSHALHGFERRSVPRWRSVVVGASEISVLVGVTAVDEIAMGGSPSAGTVLVTMVPGSMVDDADRKRREMLASAVHELRHPATIQTITLDLLATHLAADLPPEASMLMHRMERATAYLIACIDELQNRMLFDLDVFTIRPKHTALLATVESVVWQHEPLLARRRQRVDIRISRNLHVWADPLSLGHVFANLLVNAHRHSIDGDTFTITARRVRHLNQIEIRVRDHGPGVPADEQRRVFDRFYRGIGAQRHRGAGLGLAIVKALVEEHGGTAGVAAARGGGAVFWIRLPIAPSTSPARPAEPS